MRSGLVAVLLLLILVPVAAAHSPGGGYERMATKLPRDWRTPYELVDGAPIVDYGEFDARNPVTTAQFGLANFSLWVRYGDRRRWVKARRAADRLVATQARSGVWRYRFALDAPGGGPLPVPWASALAQGQGMSLLGRLYRRTHQRRYLRAIRHAVRPMRVHVSNGGLARWHRGGLYFEEYPDPSAPNFVLNGHAQALLGLYDVEDLVPRVSGLFDRGVRTLARTLREFDLGHGRSAYSLRLKAPAPPGYAPIVDDVLRELTRITGRRVFRRYADRWTE